MSYSAKVKNSVRSLYVEGLALTNAARQAGVPYQTARAWKTQARLLGDDWEHARRVRSMTSADQGDTLGEVVAQISGVTLRTFDAVKDGDFAVDEKVKMLASLADSYTKIGKAVGQINPQMSQLSTAMDVIKLVHAAIQEQKPELVEPFAVVLDAVGAEVTRKYAK